MDLGVYGRVLWRFKFLVLGGFLLAVALSLLSIAGLSMAGGKPHLSYRQGMTYQSNTTVFVTQGGFPWGRTIPQYIPGNTTHNQPSVPVADPLRLSTLASVYAQLATSDPVRARLPRGEHNGRMWVTAVPAPEYAVPSILPLLKFWAIAPTPRGATKLVNDATQAFVSWLDNQQTSAGIPAAERVVAQIVGTASKPTPASHRSKSVPIIVFMAVMACTLGLALVLDNLRSRAPSAFDLPAAQAPAVGAWFVDGDALLSSEMHPPRHPPPTPVT